MRIFIIILQASETVRIAAALADRNVVTKPIVMSIEKPAREVLKYLYSEYLKGPLCHLHDQQDHQKIFY
jgi:hypothetical protein